MKCCATTIALFVLLSAPTRAGLSAQEVVPDTTSEALFVFLDCNGPGCDFDHFRREITWVNWVRDRTDGDVHLLITTQFTGGGGRQYTLDFLGRNGFLGGDKTTMYTSDPNDTDAEIRDGLTQTIALGLVAFVENTVVAPRLRVVYDAPDFATIQGEANDPWNLWVFRIGADGEMERESQERGYSLSGSASADRVSEEFKLNFNVRGRYNRDEWDELEEGETYVSTAEDYSSSLLMVWSVTDHWSAGGRAGASKSTRVNQDLSASVGPTVEFNIFPYQESTRRSITFRYSLEVATYNYIEMTVEGKMKETLPRHSLMIAAAVQQPWGEIYGSVEGIQYLHDLATHRVNTNLDIEYRLFRGFNLEIGGGLSRIKDQFYLTAEDLPPEEVLLRRRQRETDFRFDVSLGFSYRFGSKFANIVNPRMSGGRRFHR
jgi:hypothetical protein